MTKIPKVLQVFLLLVAIGFTTSMVLWLISVSKQQTEQLKSSAAASQQSYEIYKSQKEESENLANSLKTDHGLDLAGQYKRIKTEGTDENAVQKNIAEADKTIKYEHLKKNAERYAGRPWVFTGKIIEIYEKDGETQARIALDNYGNQVIWVVGPIVTDFVEKDRVTVVGYTAGSHSYTSQANWNITVPAVAARAIMKPQGAKK